MNYNFSMHFFDEFHLIQLSVGFSQDISFFVVMYMQIFVYKNLFQLYQILRLLLTSDILV